MDASGVKPLWILEVDDLSVRVRRNGRLLLRDVRLTVRQNEIQAFVGESGAGKTILGRALSGYLPWGVEVCKGTVRLRPEPDGPVACDPQALVAFVPQAPQDVLPPLLPVSTFIAQVAQLRRGLSLTDSRFLSETLLTDVGLSKLAGLRRPFELSGGMAQRAAIAAALATFPAFLILDEPTSALDPIAARALERLLQRIRDQMGVGVLVMTHDLPFAARVASRWIVVRQGSIYAQGSLAELAASSDPYLNEILCLGLPTRLSKPR